MSDCPAALPCHTGLSAGHSAGPDQSPMPQGTYKWTSLTCFAGGTLQVSESLTTLGTSDLVSTKGAPFLTQ